MPPKSPHEIVDSSHDADATPPGPEEFAYPSPFSPRKLYELSDDFKEEYRSGPTGPGEFPESWQEGRRTKARGPNPSGYGTDD